MEHAKAEAEKEGTTIVDCGGSTPEAERRAIGRSSRSRRETVLERRVERSVCALNVSRPVVVLYNVSPPYPKRGLARFYLIAIITRTHSETFSTFEIRCREMTFAKVSRLVQSRFIMAILANPSSKKFILSSEAILPKVLRGLSIE